ncbi:protease, partial [Lactobacillus crispatus]
MIEAMNEFSLLFLFWDANFMKKSKIIFLIELVLNIIAAVFLVINNSFENLLDVGVVFLLLLLLIWN